MSGFLGFDLVDRDVERRWIEACAKVSVAGPLPMRLRIRNGSIEIEMTTRDRATGQPNQVVMMTPLPFHWEGDAFAVEILWQAVRRAFLHEAAEFFLVSGVRVMDPHVHGEPR